MSCVEGNAVKDLTKVQGNEIVSKLEYIIYYPRNQKDGIAFMFHTATYEVFISSIWMFEIYSSIVLSILVQNYFCLCTLSHPFLDFFCFIMLRRNIPQTDHYFLCTSLRFIWFVLWDITKEYSLQKVKAKTQILIVFISSYHENKRFIVKCRQL